MFAALFTTAACAQDALQNARSQPPLPVHVLKSWRADFGDRSLYLNRVAPPFLRQAPIQTSAPTDNTVPPAFADAPVPGKKSEVLFLSATVHNHKFTEIRWMAGGNEFRAFSNIDFNLLTGGLSFENEDTAYTLLLAVTNVSTQTVQTVSGSPHDSAPVSADSLAAIGKLSTTKAQYIVAGDGGDVAPQDKGLAAFDALHVFYNTNRQQLTDAYAKGEAARLAQESKPKVPLPKPPDTVVNFWPGNGTLMLDAKSKGVKP